MDGVPGAVFRCWFPLVWRRRSSIPSSAGSSRRFVVLLLAGAALGAPATAGAMTAGNLVVNGDAEAPVGSEWSAVQGMGLERYAYNGTITRNLLVGPPFDGGTAALHPRGAGANPPPASDPDVTVNEQRIELLSADVAAVATGTVRARFSAYIGGTTTQPDRIGAVAEWRDAADQPIGAPHALAEVTNVDRGNASGVIFRTDERAVPAAARAVVIRLTGTREIVPLHNGYVDDVDLRLIGIPRVEKAFSADVVSSSAPFRLTYTVRNSEDLEAKPAWSFSDALPPGIRVAPTSRATTTCADARIAVADQRISFDGSARAGQETCTASVDVVADPGRYATGAKQLERVRGLRVGEFSSASVVVRDDGPDDGKTGPDDGGPTELPPIFVPPLPPVPAPTPPADPPPVPQWMPPFVRPALRASLRPSGGGIREKGDRLRLRVRVANATSSPASRVRACVTLPSALRLVRSGERGARNRSTTRPCWTVGTLAGDDAWSTTVTVRVVRSIGSTLRPRLAATSPQAVATATATAKLRAEGGRTRARRS